MPKAVKRVHGIFENPTFMKNINGGDVKQGNLSDCWLMAGLIALANIPTSLKRICVAYNLEVGIYGFVFYRDGEWIYSIIDDKLYLKSPCWDSPSRSEIFCNKLVQKMPKRSTEKHIRLDPRPSSLPSARIRTRLGSLSSRKHTQKHTVTTRLSQVAGSARAWRTCPAVSRLRCLPPISLIETSFGIRRCQK